MLPLSRYPFPPKPLKIACSSQNRSDGTPLFRKQGPVKESPLPASLLTGKYEGFQQDTSLSSKGAILPIPMPPDRSLNGPCFGTPDPDPSSRRASTRPSATIPPLNPSGSSALHAPQSSAPHASIGKMCTKCSSLDFRLFQEWCTPARCPPASAGPQPPAPRP